ncbi:MAG TPA: hypothetical protein DCL41_06710 [Bdellovibrionales bacterium]|nr:hypothetical protein [Bdellovibrionales bacterium]|tara:strand:- start:163 stop:660 length:498 start_codon:yes stop_codon:yes gene_type:complete
MKQLNLIPPPRLECGGSLQNTRKHKRVLCSKRPLHLVLKANRNTLFKNREFIHQTLKTQAKKFGHKLQSRSVQKNHIHVLMQISSRLEYLKFIRALTGLIARKLGRGIWKFRPYTKILSWGREIKNVTGYILQNELEVFGVRAYRPRKSSKNREFTGDRLRKPIE